MMDRRKVLFFNRSSVHYRESIYKLLDSDLNVDFMFGDSRPGGIKPMDASKLTHFKSNLHNVQIGPFYWQKGVVGLLKSDYTDFITPGDPYCLSTWVLLLKARKKKKNVFLWTHGAYGDEKGFKKRIAIIRARLAKGLFLYGNYAKSILVKWGIPSEKLHVVYNSLSYDEQLEIRRDLTLSGLYRDHFHNDNKNLVFIGRLTNVKKLDQAVKAVAKLKESGVDVNITFIGDGVLRSSLESLAATLGISDRVWFYGACYDQSKNADFLYQADLCVSPGNVGLTAMHAMTFGCPVISHNNFPLQMPEFEAIEEWKTGAFFKEDDVEDLARVIKTWFDSIKDREEIRNNCYRVIDEKYNPHIQISVFKKAIFG